MSLQENVWPISILIIGIVVMILPSISFFKQFILYRALRQKVFMRPRHNVIPSYQSVAGRIVDESQAKQKDYLWGIAGLLMGFCLTVLDPFSSWHPIFRILMIGMSTYLGFRIPHLQAEGLNKRRRKSIEHDLPATIDLLIVMLDAGATFDQAITHFANDRNLSDRPIKNELRRLAQELSVTPNRQLAFQKFQAAVPSNDLRIFCSVLMQSELYGTPISRGLRGLAFEIRERQYHEIEAQGGALGPKLTIPMTLFFLPLIFIVVLAPTIIHAFHLP